MNKAIIFDLDGTLLQTHHHSCRAAHETLRALGLPDVPDAHVMCHIGEPADAFLRAIAPGYSDLYAFERLFDANEQAALKQVGTLFDGVPELLRQLTERGYRLAICSNGSREYVETALTVTNVRTYFSRLACAGEYPDKAAAVAAIIKDWNSELAVVVGDRVHDMDAAGENGIPFIAAAYGYGGAETAEADYRAQRPLDVLALTEQIESSFFQ
ncbi:MAG TPA: HAD family hydrolase [Clostridia bacterium]|nr:HAD family hydrolase [Clostridia bacterium]